MTEPRHDVAIVASGYSRGARVWCVKPGCDFRREVRTYAEANKLRWEHRDKGRR